MKWINYHHLLYFRTVVREGSIAQACEILKITQPAISLQLKSLEELFGEKLLTKSGRRLVPTEIGKIVYQYADEIFGLGEEMLEAIKGRPTGKTIQLKIGIIDSLPKSVAYKLLEPIIKEKIHFICHENRIDQLIPLLMLHELDIILSDMPIPSNLKIKGYSHFLGQSSLVIMGTPIMAKHYRKKFPHSLSGAPFILPMEGTVMRQSLNRWFQNNDIHPHIKGEFEDSALLKEFGRSGAGLFVVPALIQHQLIKDYKVATVGKIEQAKESFFALSMERKIKHPAVNIIIESAKHLNFT